MGIIFECTAVRDEMVTSTTTTTQTQLLTGGLPSIERRYAIGTPLNVLKTPQQTVKMLHFTTAKHR